MPSVIRTPARLASFEYGKTEASSIEITGDNDRFGGGDVEIIRGTRERTTNKGYARTESTGHTSATARVTIRWDPRCFEEIFPAPGSRFFRGKVIGTEARQIQFNGMQDLVWNFTAGEEVSTIEASLVSDGSPTE